MKYISQSPYPIQHAGPSLHSNALKYSQHRKQNIVKTSDPIVGTLEKGKYQISGTIYKPQAYDLHSIFLSKLPQRHCKGKLLKVRTPEAQRYKVRLCSFHHGQLYLN